MVGFILINILIPLLVAGVLVWGIKNFPKIDETFKQAAVVVIVVSVLIYLIYQVVPLFKSLPRP